MLNDITVRFGFTCKETTKEKALASTCCARLSTDGSFLLGAGVYRDLVARGAYLRSLAFDASSPEQSAGERLGVLAKAQTRASGASSQDWNDDETVRLEKIWTISGTTLTIAEIDVKAEVVGPQFGESDTWFSVATVATVEESERFGETARVIEREADAFGVVVHEFTTFAAGLRRAASAARPAVRAYSRRVRSASVMTSGAVGS
jgi:hypothetical protein